jgi:hypothetical protein
VFLLFLLSTQLIHTSSNIRTSIRSDIHSLTVDYHFQSPRTTHCISLAMVLALLLTGLALLHSATAQQDIPFCLVSLRRTTLNLQYQLTHILANLPDPSRHQSLRRSRSARSHPLPRHRMPQPAGHAESHRQPRRLFHPQGRVLLPASLRSRRC